MISQCQQNSCAWCAARHDLDVASRISEHEETITAAKAARTRSDLEADRKATGSKQDHAADQLRLEQSGPQTLALFHDSVKPSVQQEQQRHLRDMEALRALSNEKQQKAREKAARRSKLTAEQAVTAAQDRIKALHQAQEIAEKQHAEALVTCYQMAGDDSQGLARVRQLDNPVLS